MKRAFVILPMPISPLTLSHGGIESISLGDQEFKIRVPAGGRTGQRLRLPGIAHHIDPSIKNGDVYILIRPQGENVYRNQRDIDLELRLNPVKLRRGFTERIHLVGKAVDVKIPSGVKSGQRLRLRNMAEHCNGGFPGDIYLHLATETRVAARRWGLFDSFAKSVSDHFSKASSRKERIIINLPGLRYESEWIFDTKQVGVEFDPKA